MRTTVQIVSSRLWTCWKRVCIVFE